MIDFNLYLITDRHQIPDGDLLKAVAAALDGGVRAVQLREKDLSAGELFFFAERLRRLTADYGARLLINDRVDVALAVAADGVHLGGQSLPIAAARRLLGASGLIGVSTHNLQELFQAGTGGADFVTFGPVFATPSKLPFGRPVGLRRLAEACRSSRLPVFALGGIHRDRVCDLLQAGCRGVALISGILAKKDPAAASRTILTALSP
jgi:thiamine-phosphate pyrophosphorylase